MYDKDFIKEQYAQYHQIRRQLNGFSWQIPSIAVFSTLLFTSLDEKKLELWTKNPEIPSIGFLILSIFLFVLLIFHIRNITILRNFENKLKIMENDFGISIDVYSKEIETTLHWWKKIKSSTLLGVFIAILTFFSFGMEFYFLYKTITKAPDGIYIGPKDNQVAH